MPRCGKYLPELAGPVDEIRAEVDELPVEGAVVAKNDAAGLVGDFCALGNLADQARCPADLLAEPSLRMVVYPGIPAALQTTGADGKDGVSLASDRPEPGEPLVALVD